MAEKRRLLDVWLIAGNTVYKDVPYTVVCDWLQQGRLVADDKVRPAGSENWHTIEEVPALSAFLPRAEPERVEDEAEALESVEAEFAWKSKLEAEDDEIDMIPLIDVSLVLLVFFMMTAAVSSDVLSPISTPPARYQLLTISKDMYWLGISSRQRSGAVEKGPDGRPIPWFSLGQGNAETIPARKSLEEVLGLFEKELANLRGDVRIRLRGEHSLPYEIISKATVEVQKLEARINSGRGEGKISLSVSGEVSETPGR